MKRGDYLDEMERRIWFRAAPTASEKALEQKARRYMASHPGASLLKAMLAVLRQAKLIDNGTIDAAIERAKQMEKQKELRAKVTKRKKKAGKTSP